MFASSHTALAQPTGDFEHDRRRHVDALAARVAPEAEILTTPLATVHSLRDERLRVLLHTARERSPWHSERLREVDPAKISGDDLSGIPTMTKADLMANWDRIVTDPRLTLDVANRHLAAVAETGPRYLLDYYMVVTSGGSTGLRGVFAFDFEGWLAGILPTARRDYWLAAHAMAHDGERRVAVLMAALPVHVSAAISRTFAGSISGVFRILHVSLPIDEMVKSLNEFEPTHLNVYPSLLPRLVREARNGRLRMNPREILCSGEPLLPEIRLRTEETFGRILNNRYGCSELVGAETYPGSPGLHFIEDVAIYEPVDAQGRPVPVGRRAAKILITNVTNRLQPLIRYELTDEIMFLDEPNPDPWTGRRIADVQGRFDDVLLYENGVEVHPHVIRSLLARVPEISEYQVRQTRDGAEVLVQLTGDTDLQPLRLELESALQRAGIPTPRISVQSVISIERLQHTGKLKRFIARDPAR